MKKIHTRVKRRWGLSRSSGHYRFFHGIIPNRGQRTFPSEESAKTWASKQGLGEGTYDLMPAKRNRRFKVVQHGTD